MFLLQNFIYVKELEPLQSPSELAYRNLISGTIAKQCHFLKQEQRRQKDLDAIIKLWSHQMKIPLSAISLMVQTSQVSVKELQNQVIYLENYLNQLLSYFKFTQHKDDFRFEQIEVGSLVKEIIKEMAPICFSKEISFSVEGQWHLISDKKWLRFVLLQIIDNAIKYSHKGGQIKIELSDSISILDEGIGILKEDLPRLFEEGYTGYNGHEYQKASGLGLFMTKNILNQLHLNIAIDSKVDQGTRVTIFPSKRQTNLRPLS